MRDNIIFCGLGFVLGVVVTCLVGSIVLSNMHGKMGGMRHKMDYDGKMDKGEMMRSGDMMKVGT